jgi:hypothetical protein
MTASTRQQRAAKAKTITLATFTLRDLKAAAKKVGATVEDDSSGHVICYQVCAPAGKQWRESNGRHLVVCTASGSAVWVSSAIADAIDRINSGLEDEEAE